MSTVTELLSEGGQRLTTSSATPQLDAQVLLAHILGQSRTWLYTWPEKPVADAQACRYRELVERRARGEPVAHLVGTREFWSLSLKVSPATLIPRPDTERLVEVALALPLPAQARVLDLGTGTGAIALALAGERPGWRLDAVDREPAAVGLARENARQLGLANVRIYASDWFSAVDGSFDLIVSNPPYIAEGDSHLSRGDVRFEPAGALVSGPNGLADLAAIIEQARARLNGGGWLVVEHGAGQGAAVRAMFTRWGYCEVATAVDIGGRERVTAAANHP